MTRRICVVTGSRAEYGTMKPVISAIDKDPRLELLLVVAGMHLVYECGMTVKQIKSDGFRVKSMIDMDITGISLGDMARSIGLGIESMSEVYQRLKPDILLIAGDRIEALAAAITASYMKIVIVHYGGGQVSGSADNAARNAISKFAHIHLVKWPQHERRLLDLGESQGRIHLVGDIRYGRKGMVDIESRKSVLERYGIDSNRSVILIVFHPDTMDLDGSVDAAIELVGAVTKLNKQTVWLIPNADAGGKTILELLKNRIMGSTAQVRLLTNVDQDEYFKLMKHSRLMIGNSSSIITEAPIFNLQSILIGKRQQGRERFDVIFEADGYEEKIVALAKRLLTDSKLRNKRYPKYKFYGDGQVAKKFVDILTNTKINENLLTKV